MKVNKTTDYKKFKKIRGNRAFSKSHLKNLIASIAENNLLEYTPIIVNKQWEVIDGQHRLEAAKKLGIPVYYIQVSSGGDLNDVILINANLKSWSLVDYMESQILLGNPDYKTVKQFVDKYQLPMGLSINLLGGQKAHSGSHGKKSSSPSLRLFKEGLFKVTNLGGAQFLAEQAQKLKPYTEVGVWKDRSFVDALAIVYTKVKPSVFLAAVARNGYSIPRKALLRDYLILFEDIFNFRKSSGRQKFY